MATIHPYKGYLNTEFQLLSQNSDPVSFVIIHCDGTTEKFEGVLQPNVPQRVRMSHPGNYDVLFSDNTNAEIFIEDGYRFGGGEHKKSFIFDNCPWAFVVMHDRTYFHNRETGEEYVEAISPDDIIEVSKDFVLLRNKGQKEVTLYSLNEQKPIICVNNILFHNDSFIVWSLSYDETNTKEIVVYSLNRRTECIRSIYDHLSIDRINNFIFYVYDNKLLSINIINDESFDTHTLNIVGQFGAFAQTNFAVYVQDSLSKKEIVVYELASCSEKGRIKIPNSLARINDVTFINVAQRVSDILGYDINESPFPEAFIYADYVEYDIFPCKQDVFYKETVNHISTQTKNTQVNITLKSTESTLSEEIGNCQNVVLTDDVFCIYGYNESVVIPLNYRHRLQHNKSGRILSFHNQLILAENNKYIKLNQRGFKELEKEGEFDYSYYERYGIIINKTTNDVVNNYSLGVFKIYEYKNDLVRTSNAIINSIGHILRIPYSESIPTYLSPDCKYGIELSNSKVLLSRYEGRTTGYSQRERILTLLFDSSKYSNVIFGENGSQVLYRDDKKFTILDIETSETTEFENLSFIDHINGSRPLFRINEYRQAILINPITRCAIDFDLISNYQFVSPNGELYADNELKKYEEHYNKISKEIIDAKEYRRLIEQYDFPSFIWISKEVHEKRKQDALAARKEFISTYQDFFDKLPSEDRRNLLSMPSFVRLFVEIRGVAIIRKVTTSEEVCRINLGKPLAYLNYVSFSYDNQYVAIAGCYPMSSVAGGLFLIYDIKNNKPFCMEGTTKAVWSVSFSKKGAVAAYTSTPDTFYAESENDYSQSASDDNIIKGYNFLTFSPDGKYIACSRQGYISFRKMNGETRIVWGHQSSSLVSIRSASSPQIERIKFGDISDYGIADSFSRMSAVASVSFSNDNKRLMMVGNDGCIIIRNLHL